MRKPERFSDPAVPALPALALILAGLAPPVWGVAGLALGLTLLLPRALVLVLAAPLSLVLAPLVLACRLWPDWRWGWLCRPDWILEPWSWLCRSSSSRARPPGAWIRSGRSGPSGSCSAL